MTETLFLKLKEKHTPYLRQFEDRKGIMYCTTTNALREAIAAWTGLPVFIGDCILMECYTTRCTDGSVFLENLKILQNVGKKH